MQPGYLKYLLFCHALRVKFDILTYLFIYLFIYLSIYFFDVTGTVLRFISSSSSCLFLHTAVYDTYV